MGKELLRVYHENRVVWGMCVGGDLEADHFEPVARATTCSPRLQCGLGHGSDQMMGCMHATQPRHGMGERGYT